MKHVVILIDGAADTPVKELGNKTPLEVANKPYIDMFYFHLFPKGQGNKFLFVHLKIS